MKKTTLYLALLLIAMTACENNGNDGNDRPPYSVYVQAQFKTAAGEYLSDNLSVEKLNDYNTFALSTYKMRIKVMDGEKVIRSYWPDQTFIGLDNENHKFLRIKISLADDSGPKYKVTAELYCPDIFNDEEYHTMTFIYTKAGKYSYKLAEYSLEGNAVQKIDSDAEYPLIVFPV